MKKMKLICLLHVLILFFASSFQLLAQDLSKKKDLVNKEFWLNMPIPDLSDCKIMISTEGIYSPKKYCAYVYTDVPPSSDNKVKILSVTKQKKWTKVKFRKIDENESVTIYLKSNSRETFRKLFYIVFSDINIGETYDSNCKEGISKLELFKCWGFPSSITKEGEKEIYNYGLEFGGKVHGFDIATVVIENDRVISIGGII